MRIRSLGLLGATAVLVLAQAAPAHAADTSPPTAPGTPVASNITETSVMLTWPPSTDDVGVSHYEVWRYYTDIVERVATPAEPTATVTGLRRGSVSMFYVTAVDTSGKRSQASPPITVTTLPGDLEPPGPVIGFTASEITDTSVRLRWSGVFYGDFETFRIYQALATGPYTLVASVPRTSPWSVVVTGLTPGTQYRFVATAVDVPGNESAPAPPLTVTTTGTPQPTCTVAYRVSSQWANGFVGEVRIINTGPTAIHGWSLMWTFPNGQTITNLWSGVPTQSGATVTVTNMPYNAVIAANGGSVTFGFMGTWSGTNGNPTSFTLNGRPCN
ncbi:cellulose binding domain-containing protein [Allorhizocola rhizosphaerae]|uniref:cellulose binding domain-containing protein n=1 Tax=Allorhizocola rhizosphaerae TaxID=1872709 RepID=UPI000E3E000E|nr:cellulose binding domain-containing protein [Allorhizocola rhizosphaerae]